MLIDIVYMMGLVLVIPVIFLAKAALSRENEVGVHSRAPQASPLPPLGSFPPWYTRSIFLTPLFTRARLVYIIDTLFCMLNVNVHTKFQPTLINAINCSYTMGKNCHIIHFYFFRPYTNIRVIGMPRLSQILLDPRSYSAFWPKMRICEVSCKKKIIFTWCTLRFKVIFFKV